MSQEKIGDMAKESFLLWNVFVSFKERLGSKHVKRKLSLLQILLRKGIKHHSSSQ